jgi:hypothetical protein
MPSIPFFSGVQPISNTAMRKSERHKEHLPFPSFAWKSPCLEFGTAAISAVYVRACKARPQSNPSPTSSRVL